MKIRKSVGVNTSTIINFYKERRDYFKNGKAHCQKCKFFAFGYYCNKEKRSAEYVDKPKHCRKFKEK